MNLIVKHPWLWPAMVVLTVAILLGVSKCGEGSGAHPFTAVTKSHVSQPFAIKFIVTPQPNQEFYCVLRSYLRPPSPIWVCVPYYYPYVP